MAMSGSDFCRYWIFKQQEIARAGTDGYNQKLLLIHSRDMYESYIAIQPHISIGKIFKWRGAWLSSSLPAPSPSSPLELREAVVAVVTIDASRCRLWVVASSASAVTLSSAPLDIAAFESCPVTRICCKKLSESGIDEKKHKPSTSNTAASKSKDGMEDYNFAMKRMMRNPYEYHHDLGLNYTLITDNLIVGSQPQKHEDIDHLRKEEGVTYILNLQQDKDVEYWGSLHFSQFC
ncbi:uncharacterized protein [Arachis hypogaea]|uniref:uncharacterized protein n=1 Tax=Arachis hypogaea TaxID=3818 RepID=UPI003B215B9C